MGGSKQLRENDMAGGIVGPVGRFLQLQQQQQHGAAQANLTRRQGTSAASPLGTPATPTTPTTPEVKEAQLPHPATPTTPPGTTKNGPSQPNNTSAAPLILLPPEIFARLEGKKSNQPE